jgi:hypothetical protein
VTGHPPSSINGFDSVDKDTSKFVNKSLMGRSRHVATTHASTNQYEASKLQEDSLDQGPLNLPDDKANPHRIDLR